MNLMPTIFCDYDGVLVDFLRGVKEATGRHWHDAKTPEERLERDNAVFEVGEHFWTGLPPMPDFYILWNYIKPYDPHILTAVPHGRDGNKPSDTSQKFAREGKWIWNELHTKVPRDRFHAVFREHKCHYATKEVDGHVISNILIDDHLDNCKEWQQNRGYAIFHKTAAESIAQLRNLGVNNPFVVQS